MATTLDFSKRCLAHDLGDWLKDGTLTISDLMGSAWGVGSTDCDLSALPEVDVYPRIPDNVEKSLRLGAMGVLSDARLQEALLAAPRTPHALTLPDGFPSLEGSALKIPFWHDISARAPLLPSHYETVQVLQLLQIRKNDRVLLVCPRGNWWTEIIVRLGASQIMVIEPDPARMCALEIDWKEGGWMALAEERCCSVSFGGLEELAIICDGDGREWNKVLLTASVPSLPSELLLSLVDGGIAVMPVGWVETPVIQLVTKVGRRDVESQWITCWATDPIEKRAWEIMQGDGFQPEDGFIIKNEPYDLSASWEMANEEPARDRFGPTNVIHMIDEIWFESPTFSTNEGEPVDILARDLFRMGHVLQRLGVLGLSADHHSESFLLNPSAESAAHLAEAVARAGDVNSGLAWYRKAIETDPSYGQSWTGVATLLFNDGLVRESVPWLRAATEAPRYEGRGMAWGWLAKVHEKLGNKMAAFEAARTALDLDPEDMEAARIFDEFSEGLL